MLPAPSAVSRYAYTDFIFPSLDVTEIEISKFVNEAIQHIFWAFSLKQTKP